MKTSPWLRAGLVALGVAARAFAAEAAPDGPDPREIPLPPIKSQMGELPGVQDLPVRQAMPDVLVFQDGTKVGAKSEWEKRRAEMRKILEYYAVGQAPPPPGNVKGTVLETQSLANDTVKYRLVHLTFGPDDKLGFDIGIFTPASGGPFPAVISPAGTPPGATSLPRLPNGPTQGRGLNVLLVVGTGTDAPVAPAPARGGNRGAGGANSAAAIAATNPALAHGYAYVVFNNNDCGEDTTLRNLDGSWAFRNTRFFPAYPDYDWGLLRAWAWGVSRIVDYLATDPAIDSTKLIVTGVSRTGKSAMVAGAFDERLALTAPVVTGGGGVGAYRASLAGSGASENLDIMMRKYPNWFSPKLREFWGHAEKTPFDNHWFIALIAPRGFIALEGVTDNVSFPPAVKASILAAKPAYALLGVPDRLGVNYGNHGHAFTNEDWAAMLAFADQHLLGKPAVRRFDQFLEPAAPPSPGPAAPAAAAPTVVAPAPAAGASASPAPSSTTTSASP